MLELTRKELTKIAKTVLKREGYKGYKIDYKNKYHYIIAFYKNNKLLTPFWVAIDRLCDGVTFCKKNGDDTIYTSFELFNKTYMGGKL